MPSIDELYLVEIKECFKRARELVRGRNSLFNENISINRSRPFSEIDNYLVDSSQIETKFSELRASIGKLDLNSNTYADNREKLYEEFNNFVSKETGGLKLDIARLLNFDKSLSPKSLSLKELILFEAASFEAAGNLHTKLIKKIAYKLIKDPEKFKIESNSILHQINNSSKRVNKNIAMGGCRKSTKNFGN
ncbi:hypothetical protein [Piscirickettsia litoralis]|uniref:Uncharacterized protein n=1 Tax=Piscirickettsia litoralis TaxID=1891921 RepID=A0ABX2ZZ65_9GAMM|nr:hypothetical protein [Piscirickettsia litoralis]ODN41679.1 hypothetical protein BGC07_00130 [Piscirickettsia litoralis]